MPLTAFQKQVYAAVSLIPAGKVTTYKYLAQHLHCGSSQAIGQALRKNPFAPDVPCHRVVSSDLRIGGFKGHRKGWAIDEKRDLLYQEGVQFMASDRIHPDCIFIFPKIAASSF